MHDEPQWIAKDRAARFREEHPDGPVEDWREFAVDSGMELVWRHLPDGRQAVRIGRIIFLQARLSERDEQAAVRHEMCHYLMHSCNMLWWQGQPCGEIIISKYERQARELAQLLG